MVSRGIIRVWSKTPHTAHTLKRKERQGLRKEGRESARNRIVEIMLPIQDKMAKDSCPVAFATHLGVTRFTAYQAAYSTIQAPSLISAH